MSRRTNPEHRNDPDRHTPRSERGDRDDHDHCSRHGESTSSAPSDSRDAAILALARANAHVSQAVATQTVELVRAAAELVRAAAPPATAPITPWGLLLRVLGWIRLGVLRWCALLPRPRRPHRRPTARSRSARSLGS